METCCFQLTCPCAPGAAEYRRWIAQLLEAVQSPEILQRVYTILARAYREGNNKGSSGIKD